MIAECDVDEQQGRVSNMNGGRAMPRGPKVNTGGWTMPGSEWGGGGEWGAYRQNNFLLFMVFYH